MKQSIEQHHHLDAGGKPAGGTTHAVGLRILWQDGPLGRDGDRLEPNGTFVETVIDAALGRLRFYQEGDFACPENVSAIACLEEALKWCETRTASREARGVEGTHEL
jgi:hypothetical protein